VPSTDGVNSIPSEAPSNEGASDRHACGCSNCGCSSNDVNVYINDEEDDDWGRDIAPLGYRRVQRQELFESAFLNVLEVLEQKAKAMLERAEAKRDAKKQSNK
jgi:hypothetical protein